jgi:replicative DNA helicase
MTTKKSSTSNPAPILPDAYGRVQPQATDLEEAVLSACIMGRDAYDTAAAILTSEMFYEDAHRTIFEAIGQLSDAHRPVDLFTVTQQLLSQGVLEAAGGPAKIARLTSIMATAAHLEFHCLIVKEHYLKRRVIGVCSEHISHGYDPTTDVGDVITALDQDVERLLEVFVGSQETLHLAEAAKLSVEEMRERRKKFREGIQAGIDTGFAVLNRFTNGWLGEKLIILAARPGVGKTSLAIHMAKRAARKGTPVLFCSLEMGRVELADKLILSECVDKVNAPSFAAGSLTDLQDESFSDTAREVGCYPIYIDDTPNLTVYAIAAKARLMKKQGKCGMVIIDYLQLITPVAKFGRTREQEVSEITRQLKIAAKALKIPFLVLCQMNRDIEAEKREPRLSDLRESGAIEQDADIVLMLRRQGMFDKQVIDKDTGADVTHRIELFVRKNRAGRLGVVYVEHDGSMTRFYDWSNSGAPPAAPAEEKEEARKAEPTLPF